MNVFTGDVYVPQGADLSDMTFTDFLKANRYETARRRSQHIASRPGAPRVRIQRVVVGPMAEKRKID